MIDTSTDGLVHHKAHPLAGKTVTLWPGQRCVVWDWWDRVTLLDEQPPDLVEAAKRYKLRSMMWTRWQVRNDSIVYGQVDGRGIFVHDSEIFCKGGF